MITLLTGAPGSGKTAALVDLLMELGKERPLFVFGLNGLKLPHVPIEDPTRWMDEVPDGAAVVIDEVQQVWRPRGPGKAVPDHIAALETHRHRGLDFFLTTQGPNLVDANVRALVGRHIHLRDLGFLGRWWYEWPECADQCRTGWRSAPIKKRYRLPKRAFDQYKSASMHIKPIRSFPMALVVAVAALGGTGYLAWHMYGRLSKNLVGEVEKIEAPIRQGNGAGQTVAPSATSVSPEPVKLDPHSLEGLQAWHQQMRPRSVGLPHTAPRYDHLTQPAWVPYPAICVATAKACRCYDQRGNRLDTPEAICRDYADRGYVPDFLPDGSQAPAGAQPIPAARARTGLPPPGPMVSSEPSRVSYDNTALLAYAAQREGRVER